MALEAQQVADAMYDMVKEYAGKKKFKAGDLTKAMIKKFGDEYNVLMEAEENEIENIVGKDIADAIIQNRLGKIEVAPGYDGVYGVPKLKGVEIQEKKETQKNQKGLDEFY